MTAISKDIDKYISEVGTHLFCLKKNKKEVLAEIREAVFEFAENNDVHSIDDIYKRFGTPVEIAKSLSVRCRSAKYKKSNQHPKGVGCGCCYRTCYVGNHIYNRNCRQS